MATTNHAELAETIVDRLGGSKNLKQVRHCATRLRCVVIEDNKIDKAALERTPGVISVVQAGGQTQVVIGNDVVAVYEAVVRAYPKLSEDAKAGADAEGEDAQASGNPVTRFIEIISSIFVPTLGVLAGTGLLKAFLVLATQQSWLDETSSTYIILNTAADAFFFFLPVMLAYTTARRFKSDVVTALTLGAALVYPALSTLLAGDAAVTFFGIPITKFSYSSSVIPIILAVWAMGHLEKFLNRVIPVIVRKFVVPPLSLVIMLPLTLIVVGPVTLFIGNRIADAITWLFAFSPPFGAIVAGGVLGGLQQVMVIFGLHWGIIPVMIQEISTSGTSFILAPILAAVMGQSAAVLAVALKARSKQTRALAISASVSGFLAGITEPAIYGVNLRYRKPFIAGCIGGAVGGAVIAGGGVAATSFVFPSALGLPAFMNVGSTAALVIGCGVSIVVAFGLTMIMRIDFAETDKIVETEAADALAPVVTGGDVLAPVAGTVVPMSQLADPVFSSGAMGPAVGVRPSSGEFVSPVSGTVMVAMDTGHAFGLRSDDGAEVLVHIGIDTVQLGGHHFTKTVSTGDVVTVGDRLGTADLAAIEAAGYDTTTITVVTNAAHLTALTPTVAHTVHAGDILFTGAQSDIAAARSAAGTPA